MSNLIPTARVDKNGRTVIRHMKPEAAAAGLQASIPPVSLPVAKDPAITILEALDDRKDASIDYAETAAAGLLSMLDEDHKGTLELWSRLVTTGSDEARNAVKIYMREILKSMDDAQSHEPDEDDIYADNYDWTDECSEAWYPYSTINPLRIWNSANVAEEASSVQHAIDVAYESFNYTLYFGELDSAANEYPTNDAHWRGLAALVLAEIDVKAADTHERADLKPFIEWAGSHPDISAVIETARSRKVINVETLQGIMSEQERSVTAIRQGVL